MKQWGLPPPPHSSGKQKNVQGKLIVRM
jgi:hypothetical protein